jgi:hypothetical protein
MCPLILCAVRGLWRPEPLSDTVRVRGGQRQQPYAGGLGRGRGDLLGGTRPEPGHRRGQHGPVL